MKIDAVKARVEALLNQCQPSREDKTVLASVFESTRSVVAAIYGPGSPQMRGLDSVVEGYAGKGGIGSYPHVYYYAARAALTTLNEEIAAGLLGSLRLELTGALVADFVALAREHLDSREGGTKEVAAVLAAAAYEDAIRRLARERAGVTDRRKLDQVLEALKKADVLADAQFTIAQSYLKFRNDALHADWEKIERESVASVLGFTQELILRHFG